MQSLRPNPHDALFRAVFRTPRAAAALLQVVLPPEVFAELVVHTGNAPWRAPTGIHALVEMPPPPLDPWIRPFTPAMEVLCLDLAVTGLEQLRAGTDDAVGETTLEILKCGDQPEAEALYDQWMSRLAELRGEPSGPSLIATLLRYLLHVSAIDRTRVLETATHLPPREREEIMTAAQQLREEGRQEGRQAALADTLLRLPRRRFGPDLDALDGLDARIRHAAVPDLERWLDAVLSIDRAGDLFQEAPPAARA